MFKMNIYIISCLYLLTLLQGTSGYNCTENCSTTVTEEQTSEKSSTILTIIPEQTSNDSTIFVTNVTTSANLTVGYNYQNTTPIYRLPNVTSDGQDGGRNDTASTTPESRTYDENSTSPFNNSTALGMDETSGAQETRYVTSSVTSRSDGRTTDDASDTKVHLYISPTAEDFLGALIGLGVIQLLAILALLGVVIYFLLWKRKNTKKAADVEQPIPKTKTTEMEVCQPQTSATIDKPQEIDAKENILEMPSVLNQPEQRTHVLVHLENNQPTVPETNTRLAGVSGDGEMVQNENEKNEKRMKKRRKRHKEMADDSPFDSDDKHKTRKRKKKKKVFPSDDESMKIKPGVKYDKVDMSEKTTDSEENRKLVQKKEDDGTEREVTSLSVTCSTETQYISNN